MSSLVQIRQGYRARWNDLTFLVESEDPQWTLRVQDSRSQHVLYTAGRSNRAAAQAAGVEFAVFRGAVPAIPVNPEALAKGLQWQSYW
jgi:hypothetical protein